MKPVAPLIVLTCALSLSACGQSGAPGGYNTALSTKEVMARVINPAAVALWDSAGELDTPKGPVSKLPTTDEGWATAENDAAIVAEGGNMLLLPGRVRKIETDNDEWRRDAQAMTRLALAEKAAIVARDGKKMVEIGGRLQDDGCMACHRRYRDPYMP